MIREICKWLVFRLLYPLWYGLASFRPVNLKKVIFVENHESYITDNFVLIYEELMNRQYDISMHYLKVSSSGWGSIIASSLKLIWDMGNAGCIFIDESNSLFGSFTLRKDSKLIQLWHACGAFKKWGFSVADKSFGDDIDSLKKYSGHRNYSLVPVSGAEVCWAYEEAFGLPDNSDIVKPLGVSRTDMYYDKRRGNEARHKLEKLPLSIKDRRIVVYLPTFRGSIADAKGPEKFEPEKLFNMRDDIVILIKNHPFVKKAAVIPDECLDYCIEINDQMSIEELMFAADICITDYSSIVFEYSLLNKPILFYPYDMEDYDAERGFYYPYETFVPGPVSYNMEELCRELANIESFDYDRLNEFKERYMSGCDGNATERILAHIGMVD